MKDLVIELKRRARAKNGGNVTKPPLFPALNSIIFLKIKKAQRTNPLGLFFFVPRNEKDTVVMCRR